MTEKYYIVWNENRTEGFVTKDYGLAYETRKSADTNLFDSDGKFSELANKFVELYEDENCTLQTIEIEGMTS